MAALQNPKEVKTFVVERRYYNVTLRQSETERIIVLGDDIKTLTADDVLRGINFVFAPLDELVLPGAASPCPEFLRRVLRINFECALAELRRYVSREKEMYFRCPEAPPAQLNHSLVRMFVPHDLQGPNFQWNMVSEPEGRVPRVVPHGSLNQMIHAQHQETMARITSGAFYPNNSCDMPTQRRTLDQVTARLLADREAQLEQARRYTLAGTAYPLPLTPTTYQGPLPVRRGRPRRAPGAVRQIRPLPCPAASTLRNYRRPGRGAGLSGVSVVPEINVTPTTPVESSVTSLNLGGQEVLAPPNSPDPLASTPPTNVSEQHIGFVEDEIDVGEEEAPFKRPRRGDAPNI